MSLKVCVCQCPLAANKNATFPEIDRARGSLVLDIDVRRPFSRFELHGLRFELCSDPHGRDDTNSTCLPTYGPCAASYLAPFVHSPYSFVHTFHRSHSGTRLDLTPVGQATVGHSDLRMSERWVFFAFALSRPSLSC